MPSLPRARACRGDGRERAAGRNRQAPDAHGLGESFDEHVHHVYLQFLALIRTEDAREGMLSFLEKRPADFRGR
jgi:enoyl-CoA hydratase/carnithine racemase